MSSVLDGLPKRAFPILILAVLFGVLCGRFILSKNVAVTESIAIYPHEARSLGGVVSVTCSYPRLLFAGYKDGKITLELPQPETNPIIITYTVVDRDIVQASWIDATQTISTAQLVILKDNDEVMVLLEPGSDYFTALHTINKQLSIASYAKHFNVPQFDVQTASATIGTCKPS